jgi:hypothetical protein
MRRLLIVSALLTVSFGGLMACGEATPAPTPGPDLAVTAPTADTTAIPETDTAAPPVESDAAEPVSNDAENPTVEPDVATPPADTAPAAACTGIDPARIAAVPAYTAASPTPTTVGAAPPPIALKDVQPVSCSFEKTYGLAPFRGQATLVTLLSSGCGFCQNQAAKLEEMVLELGLRGVAVHVIIINLDSQSETVRLLTDRTTLPILQDTPEAAAWAAFMGRKDDIFVYDAEHRLTAFFRTGQEPDLNLGTETGYANVRTALLAAAGQK